ncbi:hypothetical protein LEN26_019057 [Aphanomyces euteiches]|nr:hypothetical protein LEN26_019057 [Aphanomyces euteiches]KAH9188958.1 hypothetical protein AeNC1_009061 [Aphanomyces euteiches]
MLLTWMLVVSWHASLSAEDCCGVCLNGVTNYTYVPSDFGQCQAQNYCCFHCFDEDIGIPSILPVAGTSFDATKTIATTGQFVQIQWEKAVLVTYVTFGPNQTKSGIPLLSSPKATKRGDVFLVCPQYPGTIYFRGFGNDSCKSVSLEYPINVITGVDGSSCSGVSSTVSPSTSSVVPALTTTTAPGSNVAVPCNLARGSIVDGVCVCASDWVGPPECGSTPVWKWFITIGGGVAAVCSIVVSVRAFMMTRRNASRKQSSHEATANKAIEMETIRISRHDSAPLDEIPYAAESKSQRPDNDSNHSANSSTTFQPT